MSWSGASTLPRIPTKESVKKMATTYEAELGLNSAPNSPNYARTPSASGKGLKRGPSSEREDDQHAEKRRKRSRELVSERREPNAFDFKKPAVPDENSKSRPTLTVISKAPTFLGSTRLGGIFNVFRSPSSILTRDAPGSNDELMNAHADMNQLEQDLRDERERSESERSRRKEVERELEEKERKLELSKGKTRELRRQLEVAAQKAAAEDLDTSELDGLRLDNQRLEVQLKAVSGNHASLEARMAEMVAEAPPPRVDAFENALDQVSEAHIKSDGPSSLNLLIGTVDDMVLAALEKMSGLVSENQALVSNKVDADWLANTTHNVLILEALAQDGLNEEFRDLLLDSAVHDIVLKGVHGAFFSSPTCVLPLAEKGLLDYIYTTVSDKQPWAVSQRWVSLTAGAQGTFFEPHTYWQDLLSQQSQQIVEVIAWACKLPVEVFTSLLPLLTKDLRVLYHQAFELSVVSKRDMLSVRLDVVLPENGTKFDGRFQELAWQDMGVEEGDIVIGRYAFGLRRTSASGVETFLTVPKVVSTSLIRVTRGEE